MKNSKCQNIQEYIEDYLEGRLSTEESAEIEEHLNSCSDCQKEFQAWQNLYQKLNSLSLSEEQLPTDFTDQVMQKITQEESIVVQSWWEKAHHLLTIPRISLKWAAALGVTLVTAFLGYNMYFSSVEQYCPNNLAEITFSMRADASQINSIAVVGDFNDWDPNRNLLIDDNNDGIWTVTLKLEPGRYEYMFIIDGQKWVPDPAAYRYVSDGFGNKNAVIEISNCQSE
ncbi:MAG: zf-HC2 domain-containing protein [Atribacterota bacterium]|nr:zf-HC2 domain-containing protein [Atribacterota bacterium]MDD4896882.1 zf-HC2 domain-containing protein [Atribacterota bacterium]MDD5638032.1 zf-HC2 domain-containing protein [Atribacterota bacterium]